MTDTKLTIALISLNFYRIFTTVWKKKIGIYSIKLQNMIYLIRGN